jgi:hypothetical protein
MQFGDQWSPVMPVIQSVSRWKRWGARCGVPHTVTIGQLPRNSQSGGRRGFDGNPQLQRRNKSIDPETAPKSPAACDGGGISVGTAAYLHPGANHVARDLSARGFGETASETRRQSNKVNQLPLATPIRAAG